MDIGRYVCIEPFSITMGDDGTAITVLNINMVLV